MTVDAKTADTIVQHLIDPELCIRCNTCEETCPSGAISNDYRNYVVDAAICNGCAACVSPCPTGAINVWHRVPADAPWSLADQFAWDALPPCGYPPESGPAGGNAGADGGRSSAAVENLYTHKQPARAVVVENVRLTADDSPVTIHHIVLDVGAQDFPFVEGQSIGVIPPGADDNGQPHMMRLYSIACGREGENGRAGHLSLTVRLVDTDHDGKPVRGLCSSYLCGLPVGATVAVAGPYGVDLLLPDDDQAPLLMVSTGTGIAPMRGMIKHRQRMGGAGRAGMMLFHGSRSPGDTAYLAELDGLDGHVAVRYAFSRLNDRPKRYVQHAIVEAGGDVATLLRDGRCHLYLCGMKGMEAGVFDALRQVCRDHGLDWEAVMADMRAGHRLHVETY